MRIESLVLLLVCAVANSANGAASFIPLSTPADASLSAVNGLSRDGSTVVGEVHFLPDGASQAFVWNTLGESKPLNYLPAGGGTGTALGSSDGGSLIVGLSDDSASNVAAAWPTASTPFALPDFTAATSNASDVSADGRVVVGFGVNSSSSVLGFRWDAANGTRQLMGLPGDNRVGATALSADGSVIAGFSGAGAGADQSVMWNAPSTSPVSLGLLPTGFTTSIPLGISPGGAVVVGDMRGAAGKSAWMWSSGGGIQSLPSLSGDTGGEAWDVDGSTSTIVGQSEGEFGTTAVVWKNGEVEPLAILLASLGIDTSGWTLRQAIGVSSDGLVIAGNATNPFGQTQGFIAIIPQPSAALLLGLGLVGLGMSGRA